MGMEKNKKEITNLELLDSISRGFSKIEERFSDIEEKMATKEELSKLQIQVSNIEIDLKSFKKETRENFEIVNDKLDDITDTNNSYDKRIEKLENKVFA